MKAMRSPGLISDFAAGFHFMRIFRISSICVFLLFVASAHAFAQSSGDLVRDRDSLMDSNNQQSSTTSQSAAQPSQDQSNSLSGLRTANDSSSESGKSTDAQTATATPGTQDLTTEDISDNLTDSTDLQRAIRTKTGLNKTGLKKKTSVDQRRTVPTRGATKPDQPQRDLDEPLMRERENPYANLPALRDLYQQLQASEQEPTRFGIEAFRTRTQKTASDSQSSDSLFTDSQAKDLERKGGFPDQGTLEMAIDSTYCASVDETKRKLEFDLYYVLHASPLLDLLVLFKTVQVMLFMRGSR